MDTGSEDDSTESTRPKQDFGSKQEYLERRLKYVDFPMPALNAEVCTISTEYQVVLPISLLTTSLKENAKFLDKFEQPSLAEADVIPWMHVRVSASGRRNAG